MPGATDNIFVFITGYGPFADVKVNPSSAIASRVAERLKRNPIVTEVRYTELETSVAAVETFYEKLECDVAEIISDKGADNVRILLLHLGVHPDPTGVIRAEVQGYNELYATVPDVQGRVLNHEPISAEDGPIEFFRESWFGKEGSEQLENLESLIEQLNDSIAASTTPQVATTGGHHWQHEVTSADTNAKDMKMPVFLQPSWIISRDAGRYLCNYALYRALSLQERNNGVVFGLFVHVVNPHRGKVDAEGGPVVAYNPTVLVQSEQVRNLVSGLIDMMTI